MERLQTFRFAIVGSATLLAVAGAHAEGSLVTVIEHRAMRDVRGAAAVNLAAGNLNLQVNEAAVALNQAGLALAGTAGMQRADQQPDGQPGVMVARIDDLAFARAAGLIAVNEASGHVNAQANLAAITLGIEGVVLADNVLSQSRAGGTPPGAETNGEPVREVSVADTAFRNAVGIVQVNQAAGSRNDSANTFALSLSAGASP